jgi:hypothetical protein
MTCVKIPDQVDNRSHKANKKSHRKSRSENGTIGMRRNNGDTKEDCALSYKSSMESLSAHFGV